MVYRCGLGFPTGRVPHERAIVESGVIYLRSIFECFHRSAEMEE